MTEHIEDVTREELAEITARHRLARDEVSALCKGRYTVGGHDWRMCVPVEKNDSDMLLVASLDDVPRMAQTIEHLLEERRILWRKVGELEGRGNA